jgi:tetraacyldisaccharide 4'-kinase
MRLLLSLNTLFMKMTPRLLLYPLSILFCTIIRIRNLMYNMGVLKSTAYSTSIISVGNITVGGTGKTPLTEYLIKLLSPEYRCALLSRGYGRDTKGPLMADKKASPRTIGDEPMQMKMKFPNLKVVVAEKRVLGMNAILSMPEKPEVVLLDDAFQHRALKPGLSILVSDFHRPMYHDICLPAGNLREPMSGKKRARIIVVNKCPEHLSPEKRDTILKKLAPDANQQVFFSTIVYQAPVKLDRHTSNQGIPESIVNRDIPMLALSGIAYPQPFFREVEQYSHSIHKLIFPDHHDFSQKDLRNIHRISKKSGRNTIIMTTEKDAIRLKHKSVNKTLLKNIWYIPIELKILFNQQDSFNKTIKNYVITNQRNG